MLYRPTIGWKDDAAIINQSQVQRFKYIFILGGFPTESWHWLFVVQITITKFSIFNSITFYFERILGIY